MEPNQTRLSRLQLFGTLLIVFIVAISMSGYFLVLHWSEFSSQQQAVSTQSEAHARDRLKAYSDQTVLTLGALRDHASAMLKQNIHDQADQAYQIAQTLWQRNRGQRANADIAHLIVSTLQPLGYYHGQGTFFIATLSGQPVLQPTAPGQEDRNLLLLQDDSGQLVVHNLIAASANPQGRGFSYFRATPSGAHQATDRIAYVHRFGALNWIIGASESVTASDQDLQRQGLDLLNQLQQNANGNFIVIDPEGILLMYPPDPSMVGQYYLALSPPMRSAVLSMLGSRRAGGFINYQMQGHPYLAYVTRLPGWNWTFATSIPTQELINSNRAARQALHNTLARRIHATLWMTLAALCAAGLFSWIFARWMNALFARYRGDLWSSHQELKQRSRELLLTRFMMDHATEIVCLLDQHERLAYQNDMARTCMGEPGPQHDQMLEALFKAPGKTLPQTYQINLSLQDKDRFFEVTQNGIEYEGEQYRLVSARDVTARVEADKERRLAARVFETSAEAILIADSQNRILTVNQAFLDSTGYSERDVLGNTPAMLASGRHSRNFYDEMWKILREHGQWSGEIWNRRKNGDIFPEWLNISVLADDGGRVSHYVALFTDISERKRQEAQVRHLAEYDFLTDLPNRALINDQLQQEIQRAHDEHGELAILFIDLDHFKNVNDTLGHSQGDELLKEVSKRLEQTLREVDRIGRSGGDEFILILPKLARQDDAAQMAEKILYAMRQPFQLSGHSLRISTSIGISLYPTDGRDIQSLLMSADLAMYHAKASGRNTFRFYSSQMNQNFNERLLLESRLREALDNNQLVLLYQPQFAIDGRTLIGCEALLRWHHPELGFIAPERFIPVAEETGLIESIGSLVLDQTCHQIAQWQQRNYAVLPVSINITATQLARPSLVDDIRSSLAKYQLSGELLELDINEDALMTNPAQALLMLDRIRACGVRLSIDDFGIGYSSPAHLKRFAPCTLKIDRSFITGLPQDGEHAAIVSAIIHLATALDIPTLAEGVETEDQRQYLERLGCQSFQGFLAGAPQSAEGMGQLLAQRGAQ